MKPNKTVNGQGSSEIRKKKKKNKKNKFRNAVLQTASEPQVPATASQIEVDNTEISPPVKMPTTQSQQESATSPNLPGTQLILEGLFDELNLLEPVAKAVKEMGFTKMMEIQRQAIPHLLEGRDVMGAAKTGSGKTLAFLIPVVELILRRKHEYTAAQGTVALVISPLRELCLQIYQVLKELTQFTKLRTGLITGGTNRGEEARHLAKGVHILVATPGRLLDHLSNTEAFVWHKLKALVIDEADRLLSHEFEEHMKKILTLLPRKRQTMLFSATINQKTRNLAKNELKSDCVYVGMGGQVEQATVDGLEQGYVVCNPERRFDLLYTFLVKNKEKKVMVFMSSCAEVKFYYELLNYIDLSVIAIHGHQKQAKRTAAFLKFCEAKAAILLCTDVAARGWDIPQVDWILQYDPPDVPNEYIHRVGRTARAGQSGKALLILRPHELEFLLPLRQAKVKPVEFVISQQKLRHVQELVEKVVGQNYFLQLSAQEGYKGMVRSYASHSMPCFNVGQLDLAAAARAFGLKVPPKVDLNVHSKGEGNDLPRTQKWGGSGVNAKKAFKSKIYKRVH